MKILKFQAVGVHGYFDLDIKFREDLTFLTGINGSGKTTVIQSIVALVTPSFFVLATLEYDLIRVVVEHEGKDLTVQATKHEGLVSIHTSRTTQALEIRQIMLETEDYRTADKEQDYYRSLEANNASHEVMAVLNSLPTPMFLDLDRRARAIQERREGRVYWPLSRRGRNIFAVSLNQSLQSSTLLAEGENRDAEVAINRLGERLRQLMILDSLELEPSSQWQGQIQAPTSEEIKKIADMRKSVASLPQILKLPPAEVESKILPTLHVLEKHAQEIPQDIPVEKILDRTAGNDALRALIGWSASKPQFQKLLKMVERVTDYSNAREKQLAQITQYLKILNEFLKDSGKIVQFDEGKSLGPVAGLGFRIFGDPTFRPINSLSSGEAQLFVILTHLFFNPLAQSANVFIIDEPELSLHVQWQELFVQSVLAANPGIQYIMATHSPSIILDRIDHCIDLSPKPVQG